MGRNLTIVLRTCSRVQMLNDNGNGRFIKTSKQDLINHCLSSLVNSINNVSGHTIKLIVLDHSSTESAVTDIQQILSHCKFTTEFRSIPITTTLSGTVHEVYKTVEEEASDLFYCIEDDYLHYPVAIRDMLDTYSKLEGDTGYMIAMNPHDDIWRYTREIYHSLVLLGPTRHYRTVKHTTYSFLSSVEIYNKYKSHFTDSANWILQRDENHTINQVWNKPDVLLFCPIKSHAMHIAGEDCKDPYVDVEELWNSVPRFWIKNE